MTKSNPKLILNLDIKDEELEKRIEIALDEYPFGLALEIENKSKEKNPQTIVKNGQKNWD